MTRRLQVVVIAVALVAIPAAYAGWNAVRAHTGTHVLLRVRPIDPRDAFRGDYAALSYPESRRPEGARSGETWFVPLRERADGVWVGGRATRDRPSGGVFVRGRVGGWQLELDGLGRFYVPEGQGRKYEAAIAYERLYADAVVHGDGSASLRKLVIR